ncbi:hypothetical protein DA2_2399 [Desulfovibrio sp. A2]|nr:hypothetical protein DA2_2399 [Desulfovibrio sp. A2]
MEPFFHFRDRGHSFPRLPLTGFLTVIALGANPINCSGNPLSTP